MDYDVFYTQLFKSMIISYYVMVMEHKVGTYNTI